MGKLTPSGIDQSKKVVSGTFTAVGSSGPAFNAFLNDNIPLPPNFTGYFNIALWGTFSATIRLERSFDGGTTYNPISEDNQGTAASYTAPVNITAYENEPGVLYRWDCTGFTSGTVNYRISA